MRSWFGEIFKNPNKSQIRTGMELRKTAAECMHKKKLKHCMDKRRVNTVCMSVALAVLIVMAGCRKVDQGQQSLPRPTATSSPVSSPIPTPAPVATKTIGYGVTRKAYEMMADGMTKTQCDEIVGFSGEIYQRYQYPAGSGLGNGGYFVRWRKGSAEISAQFDDEALTMKFNENL